MKIPFISAMRKKIIMEYMRRKIGNEYKEYTELTHLLTNFDDGSDYIGIGVAFPYKGKVARVAVRLENDFTVAELKKGILMLADAMPQNKTYKPGPEVVLGNERLSGREMVVRCQEKE